MLPFSIATFVISLALVLVSLSLSILLEVFINGTLFELSHPTSYPKVSDINLKGTIVLESLFENVTSLGATPLSNAFFLPLIYTSLLLMVIFISLSF